MGDLHEKYAILLRIYDHPPVTALQPLGQRSFLPVVSQHSTTEQTAALTFALGAERAQVEVYQRH